MRIGIGYDTHKLIKNRELIIGGVKIPYEKGLLGHSDADVLVHAIMDSLLGAGALGDIGRHFPDDNQKFKDISSINLLVQVSDLLKDNNYTVENIDTIIAAQQPKLSPYVEEMRQNIAWALDININQINIKATTTEGLGFIGQNLGISSYSIALLK